MINYDMVFAEPAILCAISNKICKNKGKCTECPTGYYFMGCDEGIIQRSMGD